MSLSIDYNLPETNVSGGRDSESELRSKDNQGAIEYPHIVQQGSKGNPESYGGGHALQCCLAAYLKSLKIEELCNEFLPEAHPQRS